MTGPIGVMSQFDFKIARRLPQGIYAPIWFGLAMPNRIVMVIIGQTG